MSVMVFDRNKVKDFVVFIFEIFDSKLKIDLSFNEGIVLLIVYGYIEL